LKLIEALLLILIVVQSIPHLRLLSYIHLYGTLHISANTKKKVKPTKNPSYRTIFTSCVYHSFFITVDLLSKESRTCILFLLNI